ncbi:MAG: hypothetical protein DWQ47_06345 [Acidobacteria bacterium]|nr:MAG: hypothetical protein DWQ32_09895 [Acidobacteriota bacterium]REK14951.1 MAG: hypothetical protein DWQ43_15585 [Acidobacteriota bacterium]REK45665.1 MAG: hypothetical protein DWQ47_06345 [Acidobacteriota bacterium]
MFLQTKSLSAHDLSKIVPFQERGSPGKLEDCNTKTGIFGNTGASAKPSRSARTYSRKAEFSRISGCQSSDAFSGFIGSIARLP